jgi:cytochrome c
MRPSPSLVALILGAAVLAGCSKKSATPDQAETPTEPASAPASAPTEAAAAEPTPAQLALVASLPSPYNAGDLANGKHVFAQCAACHTATKGGPNMTGPNLYGVFGRKAGSLEGFSYSDDLKATGFTWDAPHIDTWITNPRAVAPGTRMSFPGLKDPKDRADVIAYLKAETSPSS